MKFIYNVVCEATTLFIEAFTVMVLFNWFVADQFGIREINLAGALGLGLLVGFMTMQISAVSGRVHDMDMTEIATEKLGVMAIWSGIALAIGALVNGSI